MKLAVLEAAQELSCKTDPIGLQSIQSVTLKCTTSSERCQSARSEATPLRFRCSRFRVPELSLMNTLLDLG